MAGGGRMRWQADGRMLDVGSGLSRLPRIAAAHADIDALWLFGSYGTDRQTPLSDVDIAVLPALGTSRDVHWILRCAVWLAETLGTDAVDPLRMDTAPLWLQAEVVTSGQPLYVRDPVPVADYMEILWQRWGDFLIDWRLFQAESRRALREAVARGR
jgi:predicted nucleotidyltransferase